MLCKWLNTCTKGRSKAQHANGCCDIVYPCIFRGMLLFRGYFLQSTAKENGLRHAYIWSKSGLPSATFLLLFTHARQSSAGNNSVHRQRLGPRAVLWGTEEISSTQIGCTGAGGPLFPGAWCVCRVHSNWKPSHEGQQVGTPVLLGVCTHSYFQHIFTHLYETQLTSDLPDNIQPWAPSLWKQTQGEPQEEGPAIRVFPALCWPQTCRAAPRNSPCHQRSPPKVMVLFFSWTSLKLFETHFLRENPKGNRNRQNWFPLINIHIFRAGLLHHIQKTDTYFFLWR